MTMGHNGGEKVLMPESDAVAAFGVMALGLARPLVVKCFYPVGEGEGAYKGVKSPCRSVKAETFLTSVDTRGGSDTLICRGC